MLPPHELVPLLQLAVGPVIVISGVALILLTIMLQTYLIKERAGRLAKP